MMPARRMARLALHLVLAAGLVIAQGLAIAHAARHPAESRDEAGSPAPTCMQCATLPGLLSLAGGQGWQWITLEPLPEFAAAAAPSFTLPAEPAHAFRSRGPPANR